MYALARVALEGTGFLLRRAVGLRGYRLVKPVALAASVALAGGIGMMLTLACN